VPFQGVFILEPIFPWRCHGLGVNCPFQGVRVGENPHRFSKNCGTSSRRVRIAKNPDNSDKWYQPFVFARMAVENGLSIHNRFKMQVHSPCEPVAVFYLRKVMA
jgi:hypothetical protein